MDDMFTRTRALLGDAALEKLRKSRVALFGVGGVGGHCAEALISSSEQLPPPTATRRTGLPPST